MDSISSELMLTFAEEENSGEYTCIANNTERNVVNKDTAYVEVVGKEHVRMGGVGGVAFMWCQVREGGVGCQVREGGVGCHVCVGGVSCSCGWNGVSGSCG